jgi:hypothetical protein
VRRERDQRLDGDEQTTRRSERDVQASSQLPEYDPPCHGRRGCDPRTEAARPPGGIEDEDGEEALEGEGRQAAAEQQAPGRLGQRSQAA